jgi:hypothetical protein
LWVILLLKEDHGLSNVHRSAHSKAEANPMKKKITPKKIRKALIKGHRAIEKQREGTHLMLETIKAAQAAQKLEELLADPQIVQQLRDWRTNIRKRERDSDIWGPLNQEEETVLALLEEYLV